MREFCQNPPDAITQPAIESNIKIGGIYQWQTNGFICLAKAT